MNMNKLTFTPIQQRKNGGSVTRILEFLNIYTNILNSIVFVQFFAKSLTFHSVKQFFMFLISVKHS